jgi:hypothetical protein
MSEVVDQEGPVHQEDIIPRVAETFGDQRVGPRIARHLDSALTTADRRGLIKRRGEFVYRPDGRLQVRSRAGTGIPGERIAPEEYQEAVFLILRCNGPLFRGAPVAETRNLFGFSRTGAKLEERIGLAVDSLVGSGRIGEGSGGLAILDWQ